ncbi:hypothetical protein ACLOJK_024798 [Asimina triloba]
MDTLLPTGGASEKEEMTSMKCCFSSCGNEAGAGDFSFSNHCFQLTVSSVGACTGKNFVTAAGLEVEAGPMNLLNELLIAGNHNRGMIKFNFCSRHTALTAIRVQLRVSMDWPSGYYCFKNSLGFRGHAAANLTVYLPCGFSLVGGRSREVEKGRRQSGRQRGKKEKARKERLLYEKKRKIKQALEEGKPIPTELRNEEAALRKEIDLEDEQTAVPRSIIDDEYANASEKDPKILITTSRNPSAPLTQFVKELKIVFPNAQRMNRGGQGKKVIVTSMIETNQPCPSFPSFAPMVISEIIETCRSHDFTDVILVHEHRGQPDGLTISHLPFGPTAYFGLLNVVTRHDIKDKKSMGTMSEAYPHLILNNFSTKIGERTANILKHLFPVPKPDSKRIITFANQSDYISFRHHVYQQKGGPKSVELNEVGPRFEMRLYQIKLGTVDQREAQNEWVIRPYMNTAKKRKFLGD